MSKVTGEEMQKLLARAAVSAAARDALLEVPQKFAAQAGIELDDEDVAELKKIRKDIARFGGRKKLGRVDAKSWAIGLCQIRSVFTDDDEET